MCCFCSSYINEEVIRIVIDETYTDVPQEKWYDEAFCTSVVERTLNDFGWNSQDSISWNPFTWVSAIIASSRKSRVENAVNAVAQERLALLRSSQDSPLSAANLAAHNERLSQSLPSPSSIRVLSSAHTHASHEDEDSDGYFTARTHSSKTSTQYEDCESIES